MHKQLPAASPSATAAAAAVSPTEVLSACQDIVLHIDADEGTIMSVNEACYRTLGFKPSEMIGRNFYDFMEMQSHEKVSNLVFSLLHRSLAVVQFHNCGRLVFMSVHCSTSMHTLSTTAVTAAICVREQVMSSFATLRSPGDSAIIEFKRKHKGGKVVIVECSATVAAPCSQTDKPTAASNRRSNSRPKRCLVCVERDVTHRWRAMYGAELQRQTREAEARHRAAQTEEARLLLLASRSCDYLFQLSPEAAGAGREAADAPIGIVTSVSPRTAAVLGYAVEDLLGRSDIHLIAVDQVMQVRVR
jgi:PAS domain S-box-containing protein